VKRTDKSFTRSRTRRTCGARSESGNALEKGEEIVSRHDKGIAYVRLGRNE